VGIGLAFGLGLARCPVALILRVPCPGCGLTRATLRLLHGDLHGALAFHPLVLLIVPALGFFFGTNTWMYLRTGRWGYLDGHFGRGFTFGALAVAGLSMAVWVARFFGAFGGPVPV
jgi:hypothetical protein